MASSSGASSHSHATPPCPVGGRPDIFLQPSANVMPGGAAGNVQMVPTPDPVPLPVKSINSMLQGGTKFNIGKAKPALKKKGVVRVGSEVSGGASTSLAGVSQPFTVSLTVCDNAPKSTQAQDAAKTVKKAKIGKNESMATKTDDRPESSVSYSGIGPRTSGATSKEEMNMRRQRFLRTQDALQKSGLMGITMKTADLMKNNWLLGKEIEELKKQTAEMIKSIFSNPDNQKLRNEILQEMTDEQNGIGLRKAKLF